MELSQKPYLVRAIYEWCTDSGYTPHILVKVDKNCSVPVEYIRDGLITLNIGALATGKLKLGNEWIEFNARFNGVSRSIIVPIGAVMAIYARETQDGMHFEPEDYELGQENDAYSSDSDDDDTDPSNNSSGSSKAPWLKVVK